LIGDLLKLLNIDALNSSINPKVVSIRLQELLRSHELDDVETLACHFIKVPGFKKIALRYLGVLSWYREISHYRFKSFPINRDNNHDSASLTTVSLPRKVVFTFDDGPNDGFTLILLGLLNKYEIKAVFFVVGKYAEDFPEIISAMVESGHEVYGHSYLHNQRYDSMTIDEVKSDIKRTNNSISEYSDLSYYRFPGGGGHFDEKYLALLSDCGSKYVAHWSSHCSDSDIIECTSNKKNRLVEYLIRIAELLEGVAVNGNIILLHDNHNILGELSLNIVSEFYDLLFFVFSELGYEYQSLKK
jgi:peptidoglycan/xylan/chitin deacetylase (PgdA/CDA1 family)